MGQFVVETVAKTTVCKSCGKLRSFIGQPHFCSQRNARRVSGGKVVVLAKHKTVLVTSAG
jgi:hypothetical protein